MYTIKLDVNDTMFKKVMLFLNTLPIKNIVIEKKDDTKSHKEDNIVNFFQSSPLAGEITLERDAQTYTDRVVF